MPADDCAVATWGTSRSMSWSEISWPELVGLVLMGALFGGIGVWQVNRSRRDDTGGPPTGPAADG